MARQSISFDAAGRSGRWQLLIDSDSQASNPRPLLFDYPPARLSPTREIVAGLVLSGKKGTYKFDKPLPRNFKSKLQTLGFEVIAPDLDGDEPIGIMSTELSVTLGTHLPLSTPARDCTRLMLPPSERFQGCLKGVKELVVASNAHWLTSIYGPRILVSCGVLFSSDLLAKRLLVTGIDTDPNYAFFRDLLLVTGLELPGNPEGNDNDQ